MNEEDGEGAVFHPWAVSGDRKDQDGALGERQPALPRKLTVEWRRDKPLPDGLQGKAVPELGSPCYLLDASIIPVQEWQWEAAGAELRWWFCPRWTGHYP